MNDGAEERREASDYTYHIHWSAEDGEYVCTCSEFPSLSCLALHPLVALAEMLPVVDAVIESMREHGDPLPEPIRIQGLARWAPLTEQSP
jgi:predicted RNase H-like HicB family nuclease